MPRRTEVPHHRNKAHIVHLLREPMQGLGALEVLCRVVRVQEEPRDHLGFKKRYSPHGLSPQVTNRLRDEMAHAIAA